MPRTYKTYSTKTTPQNQPLKGQVKNSAGGYSFPLDKWKMLDRFLVLGTEGGTYYIKEKRLTRENARSIEACISEDGKRVVDVIKAISDAGRAIKQTPCVFAYAMVCKLGDLETRQYAYSSENFNTVIRTGTHLLNFAAFCEQFGGWGRGLKRAIANWYRTKPANALAYQVVKYQSRDEWSQHDLLRLAHPTPYENPVFRWIAKGTEGITDLKSLPAIIEGFELIKKAEDEKTAVRLIRDFVLPREAVPTKFLNSKDVWEALLEDMPITAAIRNLAKMTSIGLLTSNSDATAKIVSMITDENRLKRGRVHPIALLSALKVHQSGHGDKGSLVWKPVTKIVDALDSAFYLSFGTVEPTGKRFMLAIDISGSMEGGQVGVPGLTPNVAAAAMALVTVNVESDYSIVGFNDTLMDLDISPKRRLDDVVSYIKALNFGRTDCALPMLKATESNLKIDCFVTYTDSETWYGKIHPSQALTQYRAKSGIQAKSVVVGMTSNGFTIADPSDAGSMDVVGFDTAVPSVISDFATTN